MLYDKIKKLCEERKISVRQVEASTGLPNATIAKWRESDPRVSNLKAVADFFDKPIEYFLE